MRRTTTSEWIIRYLRDNGKTAGGTLEHEVSKLKGCKPSTVSRACRALTEEGKLKATYSNTSHHYVSYELDIEVPPKKIYRPMTEEELKQYQ